MPSFKSRTYVVQFKVGAGGPHQSRKVHNTLPVVRAFANGVRSAGGTEVQIVKRNRGHQPGVPSPRLPSSMSLQQRHDLSAQVLGILQRQGIPARRVFVI